MRTCLKVSKYIKHFLPLMWSGMGFGLTCAVIFLPLESSQMTLVANATSGLLGAAFGAANPNKEEEDRD